LWFLPKNSEAKERKENKRQHFRSMPYDKSTVDSCCAGVVAASVAGFFIGVASLIYSSISTDKVLFYSKSSIATPLFVTVTICVWLIGWLFLHLAWRDEAVEEKRALKAATMLVAFGVVATLFTAVRYT
jgi:hypothetical protein